MTQRKPFYFGLSLTAILIVTTGAWFTLYQTTHDTTSQSHHLSVQSNNQSPATEKLDRLDDGILGITTRPKTNTLESHASSIPRSPEETLQRALTAPQEDIMKGQFTLLDECLSCQEIIRDYLLDPMENIEQQRDVAHWLAEFGSASTTLILVEALQAADQSAFEETRDYLLQSISLLQSEASATVLIDLIANKIAEATPFTALPEDVQDTLQKSIRLNPHTQAVGKKLAHQYLKAEEENIASNLLKTQQPAMLGYLAYDEFIQGNKKKSEKWTADLTHLSHPGVLDSLTNLTEDAVLPLSTTTELAYKWATSHAEFVDNAHWQGMLSETEVTPTQKIVAAWILAAQAEQANIKSIAKAAGAIDDPAVIDQLNAAIEHMEAVAMPQTGPKALNP